MKNICTFFVFISKLIQMKEFHIQIDHVACVLWFKYDTLVSVFSMYNAGMSQRLGTYKLFEFWSWLFNPGSHAWQSPCIVLCLTKSRTALTYFPSLLTHISQAAAPENALGKHQTLLYWTAMEINSGNMVWRERTGVQTYTVFLGCHNSSWRRSNNVSTLALSAFSLP